MFLFCRVPLLFSLTKLQEHFDKSSNKFGWLVLFKNCLKNDSIVLILFFKLLKEIQFQYIPEVLPLSSPFLWINCA